MRTLKPRDVSEVTWLGRAAPRTDPQLGVCHHFTKSLQSLLALNVVFIVAIDELILTVTSHADGGVLMLMVGWRGWGS